MPAPTRDPLPHEASAPLRLPEAPALRRAAAQRQTEAFCDVPDTVLGIALRPLTPATCTRLLAVRNAFVTGRPPRLADVRVYLWFHSALYTPLGGWFLGTRKFAALFKFSALLLFASRPRRAAILQLASLQIRAIVSAAFADAPASSGRTSAPIATMEAHLVHGFATGYGWTPERTRATPLRQLFQLDRCLTRARGGEIRDEAEEDLLYRHLKARNDALAAQREGVARDQPAATPAP